MGQQNFAQAFAPAHISGIFIIDMHKDEELSGSMGCGICLETGAVTRVSPSEESIIKINGIITEAPTTMSAMRQLTSRPVIVETELSVPVGCGFGASGAGALSSALALNESLSFALPLSMVSRAAHIAEVKNRTGLGDVTGQTFGGICIRKKAGTPFSSVIDKIPCRETMISWVSFGSISTESVLSDELRVKTINKAGKIYLKELLKKPIIKNFFKQSCAFAMEIELMSPKVKDAIESVMAAGGLASQVMLGDTVFAINDNGALSEFGEVHKSNISNTGAHLL